MKLSLPVSAVNADVSEGLPEPQMSAQQQFRRYRTALDLLTESTERLHRIQCQYETLLVEVDSTIELRPGFEYQIAELVSGIDCEKLNRACILGIERIVDSLRLRAASFYKTQLQ